LPLGLDEQAVKALDHLISQRHKIRRDEHLHHEGLVFHSLHVVRAGFFKTYILHEDGREQITGFYMPGEVLGLDAISTDTHTCNSVALEDSEVCELPFVQLERAGCAIPTLMHHFHKIMSFEIVRDRRMLLGSMKAGERLIVFLLNLSRRFAMRGYSPLEFNLRMTREEIGSYLGLKLETISRAFSKLQAEGLITVNNKQIRLNDIEHLRHKYGNSSY
jgi:CRP/FNR family transcriptional regulator